MGIDVGLRGAIACIDEKGKLSVIVNPVLGNEIDCLEFFHIINSVSPDMIFMERPQARPEQNCRAALTTGRNFGIMFAAVTISRIPVCVIDCASWQKHEFLGIPSHLDPKVKSEMAAKRLFPGFDFRETERCRKAHDGKTDAALIAHYGMCNYA